MLLAIPFALVITWLLAALWLRRLGTTRPAEGERFDAIVVLGCRVRDGRASPAFARRLDVAAALFREGVAPKLVITGGKVGADVAEADAGRAYLAAIDDVILEDRATTTRENATHTRALLGDVRIVIVTTDWHVPRAMRVFRRSFTHVHAASAPGKTRGAIREVAAWLVGA